jgi:hypothetical protein
MGIRCCGPLMEMPILIPMEEGLFLHISYNSAVVKQEQTETREIQRCRHCVLSGNAMLVDLLRKVRPAPVQGDSQTHET